MTMTGPWWDDDHQMLAALHDALSAGAEVPAGVGEAGRAVYPRADLDAELAKLIYDSAEQGLVLLRSEGEEPAQLRALTYAANRLSIHLEVDDGAVHGQVVPAQCCDIEMRTPGGRHALVTADGDGWFSVRPLPPGRFRLHCRTADGGAVVTGWIAP
jgi:hypothetical protein